MWHDLANEPQTQVSEKAFIFLMKGPGVVGTDPSVF